MLDCYNKLLSNIETLIVVTSRILKNQSIHLVTLNFRYLFGFFLWNIDNIFCQNLTDLRIDFLAPKLGLVGPLTQLHGWWHIFAGYATTFTSSPAFSTVKCSSAARHTSRHAGWASQSTKKMKPPKKRQTTKAIISRVSSSIHFVL